MSDYDPRIVDLYDTDNPDGPDHDYFRSLAARAGARRVLDVGCGTGILTVTLATGDREVVGLDPSGTMLAFARNRPGGDTVTWIEGDTRVVPPGPFDLMVMSGNVAQHIPDAQWTRTLADLHRVAAKGALLAFESRNPAVRAWEQWNQPEWTSRDTRYGPLRESCAAVEEEGGRVRLRFRNHFVSDGDTVVEEELLTFRSQAQITAQLAEAGFEVTAVWGDWNTSPFDGTQQIMVFEARLM